MILVDTSIWIDHFRAPNLIVIRAIQTDQLYMHQFILGELALGSLKQRKSTLADLSKYADAPIARYDQVLDLIERAELFGRGLGYVDAHLLASCLIAGNTRLVTRDRRLHETAEMLGIAA